MPGDCIYTTACEIGEEIVEIWRSRYGREPEDEVIEGVLLVVTRALLKYERDNAKQRFRAVAGPHEN